jgi:hypothetical protein
LKAYALAGINAGDGVNYISLGEFASPKENIVDGSNVGTSGKWIFRVGRLLPVFPKTFFLSKTITFALKKYLSSKSKIIY